MEQKIDIIAELGKNFIHTEQELSVSENLEMAKTLVLKAKESKATVAKFQCHVFEDEQKKRSKERWEWVKRNERATPYEEFWVPLKAYCDELEIEFLCTPMSRMAARKISHLVKRWKVGSADVVDYELLTYLIQYSDKPIILSTGMSTKEQVREAVLTFMKAGKFLTLMHCVSIYPCPEEKLNLGTIAWLKRFGLPVGFSDHSLSTESPAWAIFAGCELIEKHLTLDRSAYGPDHHMSLLPEEFAEMVKKIKWAETVRGKLDKIIQEEEIILHKNFRYDHTM